MTDRPRERAGTVGAAVGDDAARRLRNIEDVNAQLYELHDAGALPHFEHRTEPGRNQPGTTVDVWELTFADGTSRTMPISQVRSFLRGWRLGRRYPAPR